MWVPCKLEVLPPLQVGVRAVVLEREGGPREEGSAITFWPNAFRVLDALGVAAPVRETHPLVKRCSTFISLPCLMLFGLPGLSGIYTRC